MSPRRARRRVDDARPLRTDAVPVAVAGPDGRDWLMRPVTAAAATKTYRCPGCDHEVRPGTSHVVAWPAGAPDDRRHWHTPCWQRRPAGGAPRG